MLTTMLHNGDQSDTTPAPAAQIRVTPQELADALARLEARKEADQRHLDGTVPLGEVVEQLGLDATPDELWREVQAGREQTANAPRRARQGKALKFGGVFAAALLLWIGICNFILTRPAPPPITVTKSMVSVTPQPAPITFLYNVARPSRTGKMTSDIVVCSATGEMRLLSEVADNRPFSCGLIVTDRSAAFAAPASNTVLWTLIKHSGKVYMRGWIAGMSDTALRASTVEIYRDRAGVPSGLKPIPVTLPLDGFLSNPGLTGDDMISASQIKPDTHFREKW